MAMLRVSPALTGLTSLSGPLVPERNSSISGNTTAGRWFMIDMFAAEVPEPSTFMLLGISLLGLAAFRWRRR